MRKHRGKTEKGAESVGMDYEGNFRRSSGAQVPHEVDECGARGQEHVGVGGGFNFSFFVS